MPISFAIAGFPLEACDFLPQDYRETASPTSNQCGWHATAILVSQHGNRYLEGTVQLPKKYVDEMVAHALADDPDECCGIIAGRNGKATKFYRMSNPEHSPYRYSMDTKELFKVTREIDDSGWEVLVIYHSHTHTEAYPSPTDVRLASYPEAFYILVSLMDKKAPAVKAYRIMDGHITPEKLDIVPG